ncbi:MAG TPA: prolyl oligopeptidase family serine peptidase [Verrucomicrobiae bacterium]
MRYLSMILLSASLLISLSAIAQPAPKQGAPAAPRVPEGVKAHRDLAYVETDAHERHRLDLYIPEKSDGPLPLIIWVHGGGWQNGSKDGCPPLREGYTQRGYAVASINYRLSGHATFPAQIEDCKTAIRWLRAHSKQYNLDTKRFGVWGSSAGGHLVALLGTSGDVKEFDQGANLDQSSRVQAVCDFYGPTDFVVFVTTPKYESHAASSAPEAKLIGGAVLENKDKAAKVNPITYVSADDPPFLIVHGDKDGTVPLNQSQLLFDALKKANRQVHFHTIHGAGHGGPGFNASAITTQVQTFFDKFLKGSEKFTPSATTSESSTADTKETATPASTAPTNPKIEPRRPTFEQVLIRSDKNNDGKISRDEFAGPPALFQRLDRNSDGLLNKEEHESFIRPGQAGTPATPAQPKESAPAPEKNSSSRLDSKAISIKDFKLTGEQWTCDVNDKTMEGILVKPEGKGPFPAILISHGYGSNGKQFGTAKARDFVKMGFVCIATDYAHARGGSNREDFGASDENVRRAKACLAILKTLPIVDANRLAAYGNSMGGFLSIRLAADAADSLKAVAITAGGTASAEGNPAPPISIASKIKVPILMLHGTTDTVVRPEQSEALKKALDEAKVPNERHTFEGIGHELQNATATEVMALMKTWFQKQGVLE